jgi:hypothetical protein
MRSLDPAAGPVERLATELRALRALAGDLPFWKMARRCEVSKSALAAAAAGRQLPSEKVTREFVRVCGGDWPWWRDRWSQAAAELAADDDVTVRGGELVVVPRRTALNVLRGHVAVPGPAGPPEVPARPGRRFAGAVPSRFRRTWWLVAAAVTAGAVVVAFTQLSAPSGHDPAPRALAKPLSSPSIGGMVPDGTDPKPVGCFSDKVVLEVSPVLLQKQARLRGRRLAAGTRVGTINLTYSPHCAGAWARFDPTPGLNPDPNDTTVGTTTIEADRPADNTEMLWRMGHIDSTYSGILLTGIGCVVARARIDMVGQNVAGVGQTHCLPRRP